MATETTEAHLTAATARPVPTAINQLRDLVQTAAREGQDLDFQVVFGRLAAEAMIESPAEMIALLRTGELAGGQRAPTTPGAASTSSATKKRKDEEEDESRRRAAAAALAGKEGSRRSTSSRRKLNERGDRADKDGADEEVEDMDTSEEEKDKDQDRRASKERYSALEELLKQQQHFGMKVLAGLQDIESILAVGIKIVRKSREVSAKRYFEELEKLAGWIDEHGAAEVAISVRIESELIVICKSDGARQRFNDRLKDEVIKRRDLDAMVILMRPSLRSAISRPTQTIFGVLRRAIGSRPMVKTLNATPARPNWAVTVVGGGVIAAGTLVEGTTCMSCMILEKFEVNGQTFLGIDIQAALEEDGAKPYSHYPFTVMYEMKTLIEPGWMMKGGTKSAAKGQDRRAPQGGGKGGGTASSASTDTRPPPPDPWLKYGTEREGRGGGRGNRQGQGKRS